MADQRRTNRRRPAPQQQRRSRRRRPAKKPLLDLNKLLPFRNDPDFKPDAENSGILNKLFLTQYQRDRLLRWGSYIGVIILLLMIQDVIMSQVTIFGATTDLAVCVILLITVIEGVEVGSVFVLIASLLYYFSGSAPGPYAVGFLTYFGIGACIFRQLYWHRSQGSIVLCAGLALMLYEIGVFGAGIFLGLTRWDRFPIFVTTGLLSCAVMIPLYNLINRIGQIGGRIWKE